MPFSKLRVSLGSAIVLGLRKGKLPYPPTTAYIMAGNECVNNCAFCTQAREASSSGDLLSRVTWPEFSLEEVLFSLKAARDRGLSRICLQSLTDPLSLKDLPLLIERIAESSGLDISISISPADAPLLRRIREAGAERVGIALDGASPDVLRKIKGSDVGNPYTWGGNWASLEKAVDIFGEGNVSTHIIVGLEETDRDVVGSMLKAREMGILVSLFAYTPMKGTKRIGDPPELDRYRALQLARSAVFDRGHTEGFEFDDNGKLIDVPQMDDGISIDNSIIFMTRGCPDCNRPYYNERPGGPIFNYPGPLDENEYKQAMDEAVGYIRNG
ncbi:MAG: radical SAM protein [Thermoplasmatota archaeon]